MGKDDDKKLKMKQVITLRAVPQKTLAEFTTDLKIVDEDHGGLFVQEVTTGRLIFAYQGQGCFLVTVTEVPK